jgi:hypothetical protein
MRHRKQQLKIHVIPYTKGMVQTEVLLIYGKISLYKFEVFDAE